MTKARADQSANPADLSESARAVVHDAGDPRIDAHLRALGLAPDPGKPGPEAAPAAPAVSPELMALHARVVELEVALAAAGRRARGLTAALAVALVILVLLAVLVVGRSA